MSGTPVSTEEKCEAVLYAVAEKTRIGLDMEETVRRAKSDLLSLWMEDMRQIESDTRTIERGRKGSETR